MKCLLALVRSSTVNGSGSNRICIWSGKSRFEMKTCKIKRPFKSLKRDLTAKPKTAPTFTLCVQSSVCNYLIAGSRSASKIDPRPPRRVRVRRTACEISNSGQDIDDMRKTFCNVFVAYPGDFSQQTNRFRLAKGQLASKMLNTKCRIRNRLELY